MNTGTILAGMIDRGWRLPAPIVNPQHAEKIQWTYLATYAANKDWQETRTIMHRIVANHPEYTEDEMIVAELAAAARLGLT